MPNWVIPVISCLAGMISGVAGSFIAMRVGIAVLQTRLANAEAIIAEWQKVSREVAVLEQRVSRCELDIHNVSTQIREELRTVGRDVASTLGSIGKQFEVQIQSIASKVEGRHARRDSDGADLGSSDDDFGTYRRT